jgi:acetoin utilization deacetylase AcuC-like enzyme
MNTPIPVFYRPEMSVHTASFSQSPEKPAMVVTDWLAQGFPITINAPLPLSTDDLMLAHHTDYVEGVFQGTQDNGFRNRDPKVPRSQLFTIGALYEAAKFVLQGGARVACAPVSGFHHAGFDSGSGFCTFNGLMVTALKIAAECAPEKLTVAILDLDFHFGNGTEDIMAHVQHPGLKVRHFTSGNVYDGPTKGDSLLRYLPKLCDRLFEGADLVLYQAGADMHIDDPLGGMLTTEQMLERDRIVFERMRASDAIGMVWNLAGGYQRDQAGQITPVLKLHRNTMRACIENFGG